MKGVHTLSTSGWRIEWLLARSTFCIKLVLNLFKAESLKLVFLFL